MHDLNIKPVATLSAFERFVIAFRYARFGRGQSILLALAYAATDPIATLNPIYSKPAFVASMLRHTASAIEYALINRDIARRIAAIRPLRPTRRHRSF